MQKTKVISLRVINILCQKKANMGANFSVSDLNKANAQRRVKTPRIMFLKDQFMAMENPDASRDPNKTSRIKAFHSKDQWEVYFNASKESKKLVVIDFTATWCGPCRSMEPTFEEYADKFKDVDFIKIDVDELPNVAAEFGVHSMPTFLLMKNGEQVDKVVGVRREDLHKKIEKHRK